MEYLFPSIESAAMNKAAKKSILEACPLEMDSVHKQEKQVKLYYVNSDKYQEKKQGNRTGSRSYRPLSRVQDDLTYT